MSNAVLLGAVKEALQGGHSCTLNVRGYSMRPFLENMRDKALLQKPTVIRIGDAVLAEIGPRHYVLHRIVDIQGQHVTLRGDGNLNTEHCLLSDVKATAIGFYRKGRSTLDSTTGNKWRTYSWLWMRLLPLRRYLLAFYRRIWLKLFKPI